MVASDVFGRPDIKCSHHMGARITISRQDRHFSGRDTVRASAAPPAVADNTLIIKQKSTLPVSKTRQDKSLFCSLSDIYLPPAM